MGLSRLISRARVTARQAKIQESQRQRQADEGTRASEEEKLNRVDDIASEEQDQSNALAEQVEEQQVATMERPREKEVDLGRAEIELGCTLATPGPIGGTSP